jgi:hypothetical protein
MGEELKHIQNYLFSRFSSLDNDEFFKVSREILKGSNLGKEIISNMVDQIITDLQSEDYEEDEYEREYGKDDESSGFDNLLGSLGISLSPDDDDDGPTV